MKKLFYKIIPYSLGLVFTSYSAGAADIGHMELLGYLEELRDCQEQLEIAEQDIATELQAMQQEIARGLARSRPQEVAACSEKFASDAAVGEQCKTKVGKKEFTFTLMGREGGKVAIRDDHENKVWTDVLDSKYAHDNFAHDVYDLPKDYKYAIEVKKGDDGKIIKDAEGNPDIANETACSSEEGKRAAAGVTGRNFGLPTIEEFRVAESHGFRDVLPNMKGRYFWSASLYPDVRDSARGFGGSDGFSDYYTRDGVDSVRCVGR